MKEFRRFVCPECGEISETWSYRCSLREYGNVDTHYEYIVDYSEYEDDIVFYCPSCHEEYYYEDVLWKIVIDHEEKTIEFIYETDYYDNVDLLKIFEGLTGENIEEYIEDGYKLLNDVC